MSSIYPKALDGYAQIPLVVDTVTEVKADTVNRLRSAIVNIEKELGIEPKGTYADVRARLDAIETMLLSLTGDDFDLEEFSNRITSIETKVNQLLSTTLTDQSITLSENHGTVLVDASLGDVTINLPSVNQGNKKIYHIKKIDPTPHLVIIKPQDGETLDGESHFEINFQYDSYSIINHSTGWFNI